MKKHWADKLILRSLLWFLVLPHSLKAFIASRKQGVQEGGK